MRDVLRGFSRGLIAAVLLLGVLRPAFADTWPISLKVDLDPARRSLQVDAELRPTERDFHFVLHSSLSIVSAEVDGKPMRVERAGVGARDALKAWRIRLPAGGTLRLRYGGTLPALDARLDHREVLQGLPPMAAEAGSYLPAGGAWYPRPAETFAYRIDVRVPGGQRVVVPGRLVEETFPPRNGQGEGVYRVRFEFAHAADGIDLMAGPWVVREQVVPREGAEPLRLRTYFPPALDAEPDLADAYLRDSARYIAHYSERIGAYPFTEFSVVASPLPTGFGMPTLTYLGEQVLRLPFIRATSLGHEVLHNWWGNGVLVDYARGNWSEGLTTFMADYAYKEAQSDAAAREMRLGWLRDFAALPADAHQPLASFRSRTHGAAAAVGYGKASMVFVMLRDLIGAEAFDEGIRLFWAQNRFRIAGWAQLQAAFEKASGRALDDFFRQWLTVPGGAAVTIEQARFVADGGQGKLQLSVRQSGPQHVLNVPVRLETEQGVETRWISSSRAQETIELTVARVPQALRLDPELRVWRLPDTAQLPPILRQWMLAPAPRVVIANDADVAVRDTGQTLAARLFERPARLVGRDALKAPADGTLLVGTHAAVDATLAGAGLPPRPPTLGLRGGAQVWTLRTDAGTTLAVVSARDVAELAALQRPLPHYGGQSWLVAEAGRVVERGVWDAPGTAVPVLRD
ncbi:MAG: aminopeptidase [Thauera sp.]|nr:aminopeptidase [Thauera sp.]